MILLDFAGCIAPIFFCGRAQLTRTRKSTGSRTPGAITDYSCPYGSHITGVIQMHCETPRKVPPSHHCCCNMPCSLPEMISSASRTMPCTSSSQVGTSSIRPITVPALHTLVFGSPVSWKQGQQCGDTLTNTHNVPQA